MLNPYLIKPTLFHENVRYRFFDRKNGVSTGEYESLNCSIKVGDDPAKVRENVRRVAQNMGCTAEKLFVLHQTHSNDVVVLTSPEPFEKTPHADALVTNVPNICLGIKTADCAPIIFADEINGVVAAAHAGWRGAVGQIIENTLLEMENLGAERKYIGAMIGPCIGPESYDVGNDMYQSVLDIDSKFKAFFAPTDNDKYLFDLPGLILTKLNNLEVGASLWCGENTFLLPEKYFSYRYALKKGQTCGRQISVIGLLAR